MCCMCHLIGCSSLPPSDAEEVLAIESECKNISLLIFFLKSYKNDLHSDNSVAARVKNCIFIADNRYLPCKALG